jgi:hypothetical protein
MNDAGMNDAERRRQAYQRYMEMSVSGLREQWARDGRTDWAESALRDALLDAGVGSDELDAVAARRSEIAAQRLPELSATLWQYGAVGRVLALGGAFLVGGSLYHLAGMMAATVGVAVVLGTYISVLYKRQNLHRGQAMRPMARFWMTWQFIEAILITVVVVLGMLAKVLLVP